MIWTLLTTTAVTLLFVCVACSLLIVIRSHPPWSRAMLTGASLVESALNSASLIFLTESPRSCLQGEPLSPKQRSRFRGWFIFLWLISCCPSDPVLGLPHPEVITLKQPRKGLGTKHSPGVIHFSYWTVGGGTPVLLLLKRRLHDDVSTHWSTNLSAWLYNGRPVDIWIGRDYPLGAYGWQD